MRLRPLAPLLLTALLGGLVLGACGGRSPEREAADRESLQEFFEEYLPRLAEAYRTGEVDVLAPYAAEKERAKISVVVRDLARGGEVLAPELASVRVEELTVWSEVNAYATTVEIWDIRTYALGSENVVREQLGQSNRVRYQLKRERRQWRVLWREIVQTFD